MRFRNFIFAGSLLLAASASLFGAEVSNRKMTWAHYTPWHTPFNNSLSALKYYNFPLLDSTGTQIGDWKREIQLAKAEGIDGFFPDIVAGKNGTLVFFEMMESMLKAAEGTDFQIGACLDRKTNVALQIKMLKQILDRVGKHPNYPHWNGKPVVNFYTFTAWSPEEIAEIRAELKKAGHDIFVIGNIGAGYKKLNEERVVPHVEQTDMIYPFGMMELDKTTIADKGKMYERIAKRSGKELMQTLYPGYYGAWLNGRNDYYQVHCGFDQMHRTFEAIDPAAAKWIHCTTWNDHDESSLMPMVFTEANQLIVKAYSDKFKGISTVTGKPEVVFAYHREELPGTLLRFEAMTLPTLESGKVEVKGRLLDETGKEVAQLPAKSLAGNAFDRAEWLVPSTALAKYPALIPEMSVNGKKVRLPEMLLVSGWHQNAVTVKAAAGRIIMPQSSLSLKAEPNGRIRVTGKYDSPVELKRVSLWRNDRPVAVISPQIERKNLFNLYLWKIPNITVTPIGGRIISATKTFAENHTRAMEWSAASFRANNNHSWINMTLTAAGIPAMKFRFTFPGQAPLVLSAEELMRRRIVEYAGGIIQLSDADGTMQSHPALKRKSGSFNFSVFGKARPQDRWQLRFDTADGRYGWSAPIWPFAVKRDPVPAKLIETSVTLETASKDTGWDGRSEYLSKEVPFRTPQMKNAEISPLSIRGGRWDFEENGNDRYGDMSVTIPQKMFCEGKKGEGKALRFTGKDSVKMRLRTYPVGSSTVEFLIRPEGKREKTQGIITRHGWSSAVNIYLLPNGRIEAVRDGGNLFKVEKTVSSTPVPDNVWSKVRVTCDNEALCIYINDEPVAEQLIAPQRCYGNCTWYLGKGDRRSANFTGCLDAVTVYGAAFAPEDANEPKLGAPERFSRILPPAAPQAEKTPVASGKWLWPANIERRPEAGDDAAPSTVKLKGPVLAGSNTVLLGPGPNTIREVKADGVELKDNTMVSIRLRRFDRAEPVKAWYAVLISIGNDENKLINFNFGSSKSLMITEMRPKWKIARGNIAVTLPADLQFAKRNGMLFLMIDGKLVYTTDDDPNHPFTKLSFRTSSPNQADAAAVRIDPPVLCKLK